MDPTAGTAIWYFGYGSNMSPAIFAERRGMHPLAARCARLEGYRLCFSIPVGPGERGVANLEAAADGSTFGVLYLITPEESGRLDRSEGVHVGLYRRVPIEVTVDAEERVAAFTYCSSVSAAGRKPSARYMGLLLEGARHHGLPAEYLTFLTGFELAWDEREGKA